MRTRHTATLAAALMVLSCKSYSDPAAPDPDPGSMLVTVTSSGSGRDPDGYDLAIGAQQTRHIERFAEVSLAELAPGAYELRLSGLDESQQCRVTGSNPRSIAVASGAEAKVIIGVYCGRNTGTDPNFLRRATPGQSGESR